MAAAEITQDVGIFLRIFEIIYIYFFEVYSITRVIFGADCVHRRLVVYLLRAAHFISHYY